MANLPRVLIWDIETSPSLGYVWQKWDANVLEFEADWHVLTIAWKWLGERRVHILGLPDFPRYADDPESDYELAAKAHELFSEAQVVVAHNGIAFDTRKIQARMLIHGFDPPAPFREVDTLRIARKHFAFTSNRLDDLCRTLGIGGKEETGGFATWLGCMRGDPAAWTKMKRYNKHDVVLLEQLYLKLRPWATNHPNLAFMAGDDMAACPACGASGQMTRQGIRHNQTTSVQEWKCGACGKWARSRLSEREPKPEFVG